MFLYLLPSPAGLPERKCNPECPGSKHHPSCEWHTIRQIILIWRSDLWVWVHDVPFPGFGYQEWRWLAQVDWFPLGVHTAAEGAGWGEEEEEEDAEEWQTHKSHCQTDREHIFCMSCFHLQDVSELGESSKMAEEVETNSTTDPTCDFLHPNHVLPALKKFIQLQARYRTH